MKKPIRVLSEWCFVRGVDSGLGSLSWEVLIEPLPTSVLDLCPQEERDDRRGQVAPLPEGEGLDSEREDGRRSEERRADHVQDRAQDAELEPDLRGGERQCPLLLDGELALLLQAVSSHDAANAVVGRVTLEQKGEQEDDWVEDRGPCHGESFS